MIIINNYALKTINYDELNMKNSSLDICSHSIYQSEITPERLLADRRGKRSQS